MIGVLLRFGPADLLQGLLFLPHGGLSWTCFEPESWVALPGCLQCCQGLSDRTSLGNRPGSKAFEGARSSFIKSEGAREGSIMSEGNRVGSITFEGLRAGSIMSEGTTAGSMTSSGCRPGSMISYGPSLIVVVFHRHPSGYECSPGKPGIIQLRNAPWPPEEGRR